MEVLVLKQDVVNQIKASPKLQGDIAEVLGLGFGTMYAVLNRNDIKLTTASVLQIVAKHLAIAEKELLTNVVTSAAAKKSGVTGVQTV